MGIQLKPSFVAAFMEGLDVRAVLVLTKTGCPSKIGFTTDLEGRRRELAASGVRIHSERWLAASQAEMVVERCRSALRVADRIGPAGWIEMAADAVLAEILEAAHAIGAELQTTDEATTAASETVRRILSTIDALNNSGGLKELNRAYKVYRQKQIAAGRGAASYSAYLSSFATTVIRLAASSARSSAGGRQMLSGIVPHQGGDQAIVFSQTLLAHFARAIQSG